MPFSGGDDLRQLVLHLYNLGYGIEAVESITRVPYSAIWNLLDKEGVEIRGRIAPVPVRASALTAPLHHRGPAAPPA